ncbi:MAG: DNA cytosine methyltransferase, partial [Anaerotignaceae bacterium]
NMECTICLCDQGGERMDICEDVTGTLRASMGGNQPIVMETKQNSQPALFDNHGKDCRYNGPLEIAPTVAAVYGTGGNNIPLLSKSLNTPKSILESIGKKETYCIAANTIDRQPQNGGNGQGVQRDISYTLTTGDIHAIYKPEPYQEVVGALMARDFKGVNTTYVNQSKCIIDNNYQEVVGALCSGDYKGPNSQYVSQDKCIIDDSFAVFGGTSYSDFAEGISTLRASGGTNGGGSENLAVNKNLVRRLTPLECERLQGFPDGWTAIEKSTDSPRYKALGNSVAIPCVDFVMRGIAFFLKQQKEENDGVFISR